MWLTMDFLFDTYTDLLAKYTEFLKQKFPTEEERVVKAKAFDTVRTLLPMATLSQVALFGNGQAFEYFVNRSLDHALGQSAGRRKAPLRNWGKLFRVFATRPGRRAKKYREYKSGMGETHAENNPGNGFAAQ